MYKILKNPFYIYTALWMVYLMQDMFSGAGGLLGRLLLLVLLVWSSALFFKTISHKMPTSLVFLTILLASYIFYGLIPIVTSETLRTGLGTGRGVPPFSYMKSALISIVPIYAFFHFSKKGYINTTSIKWLAIAFFACIVANFYHSQRTLIADALNGEEFTNNVGYEFLMLIPYLYFPKKKYALPLMAGISIFIVMAMKRGAILIGAVCILAYLYGWIKNSSKRRKLLTLVGISVFVFLGVYYVKDFYQNSLYFQYRVEQTLEGNTSGRDRLAQTLLDYYLQDAIFLEQVFGGGANATLKHTTSFAHNDWLEMLINQGIVGVFILLTFYLALFLDVRRMRNINRTYYSAFMMLFFIVFTKTFFSMSICNMKLYTTLLMGYFLYKISRLST